jgi:aminoglycoside phosphotransferase (APT) family kinase protein
MHADDAVTDAALVRRLLARQFPQWRDLPITPVRSSGTDHHIYRLGEGLSARLPRIGRATAQAATEARWLPWLAPQLPLALPVPVATGRPDVGYPFDWAVHEWLPGVPADRTLRDLGRAAVDLAGFVTALWATDTAGSAPRVPGARGGPLAERDDAVHSAIDALGERIDGPRTRRCWQRSLAAPAWGGPEVRVHGDLLPGNLLVVDGRLSAVIDWGALTVGDPACDLLPAWNLFAGSSRRTFLAASGVDEATRLRGRGWALSQAVVALPYYWDTHPGIVRQALHAVTQVLADEQAERF